VNTVLVVIPARYESVRFPGKPMADLGGQPMIAQVWQRARQLAHADRLIIATDDSRIVACAHGFGAETRLTASFHKNGTERMAEVAASLPYPVVVNLQGDLPLFSPKTLDRIIVEGTHLILSRQAECVTVKAAITSQEELLSPHIVKVVSDPSGSALYFSRSPIPYLQKINADTLPPIFYRHYGIYMFHLEFLLRLAKSDEGVLEKAEQLEQLRVLELGGRIHVIEIPRHDAAHFFEVNHPEDLVIARKILKAQTALPEKQAAL